MHRCDGAPVRDRGVPDGRQTGVPAGEVVLVSSPLPLGVAEAVQRDVERTSGWLACGGLSPYSGLAQKAAAQLWRLLGQNRCGVVGGEGTERPCRKSRLQVAAQLLGGRILLENRSGPAAGNLRRGRALRIRTTSSEGWSSRALTRRPAVCA